MSSTHSLHEAPDGSEADGKQPMVKAGRAKRCDSEITENSEEGDSHADPPFEQQFTYHNPTLRDEIFYNGYKQVYYSNYWETVEIEWNEVKMVKMVKMI